MLCQLPQFEPNRRPLVRADATPDADEHPDGARVSGPRVPPRRRQPSVEVVARRQPQGLGVKPQRDPRARESSSDSDADARPKNNIDSASRAFMGDHIELKSSPNLNPHTHPNPTNDLNPHTNSKFDPHADPASSDSEHSDEADAPTEHVPDRHEHGGDRRRAQLVRAEDTAAIIRLTTARRQLDANDLELRRSEAVILAREAQRKTQLETKREPLVTWLNDCCGLGARVEEFIALGVDEVSDFNLIETADLEDMGLTTPMINMFMSHVDVEDWEKDFINSSYV